MYKPNSYFFHTYRRKFNFFFFNGSTQSDSTHANYFVYRSLITTVKKMKIKYCIIATTYFKKF